MPDRKLEHNRRHFDDRVFTRLEADGQSFPDFKAVFAHFRSYDPSRTGSYTTWLIKTYCEGGFLFEDLAKTKETLQWFDEVKRRLPVDRRNIADYPTLADVWKVVKPFVETPEEVEPSKREQRRKEQDEVYAETVFLEEADDYRAVIPLTEKASKWWGRGTRWCTAADKDNKFPSYFRESPLVIIDFKDGHKWQFWASDIHTHFTDEDDVEVCSESISEKWNAVKKILLASSAKNLNIYKYVPKEFRNSEFFLELIKANNEFFKCLPFDMTTIQHCIEALDNRNTVSHAFRRIPAEFRNSSICLQAIKIHGGLLKEVPVELRTFDLCMIAVQNDHEALEHVPEKFLTKEMCLAAVRHSGWSLRHVPFGMRTYELCLEAAKSGGDVLAEVPTEYKTYELCLEAVKNKGLLSRVPIEFRTRELCLEALKVDGRSLSSVPLSVRDAESYLEAVRSHGPVLFQIDPHLLTHEICLAAVKNDGEVLPRIPPLFRTHELYLEAVKNNPLVIYYIPAEDQSRELWLEAVKSPKISLGKVPYKYRNREIYEESAKKLTTSFHDLPTAFLTPEMCLEHVRATGRIHTQIPREFLTDDFLKKCKSCMDEWGLESREKNGLNSWIEYFECETNSFLRGECFGNDDYSLSIARNM